MTYQNPQQKFVLSFSLLGVQGKKQAHKTNQTQCFDIYVNISGNFFEKSQRSCPTVGPDSSQAGIGNDDMNWPHPKTVHSVAAGAWRCVKGVSFRHFFTP